MNSFVKSHGLGNSYLILEESAIDFILTPPKIRSLCSADYGLGTDGILLKVHAEKADFGVRIFNPDGSEAEKSGNGVRIFAKYVFDNGYTNDKYFKLDTLGGIVGIEILEEQEGKAKLIKANMGRAIFEPVSIPAQFEGKEVLDQKLLVDDKAFLINLVSMGNPHCVVFVNELKEEEIKFFGPKIENHPSFPARINVQFARIISPNEVEILIWERGAGYTLASGSSSCAVAALAHKKGLVEKHVNIRMPGGVMQIDIGDNWKLDLTGPVEEICRGKLS